MSDLSSFSFSIEKWNHVRFFDDRKSGFVHRLNCMAVFIEFEVVYFPVLVTPKLDSADGAIDG